MITRRELLQVGAATAALAAGGGFTRAMAQQRLSEAELLKFDALGNVTLLHVADIHGQLLPVYFREPSINLGVGAARGQPPHLTGSDFLKRFGIPAKSAAAYALTSEDFSALAKTYGRIGGLDRLPPPLQRRRAARGAHGRLHGAAQAGRHDRSLGIHLWRGAGAGADQGTWLSVFGAQCARHRMERAGVRADEDVRARRGENRRARASVSLYAGRQSALADAEMDVRHSRGGRARQRRKGAQGRRATGGAALA